MHLSSLGPTSWAFSSQYPQGPWSGVAAVTDCLMVGMLFPLWDPQGSPSRETAGCNIACLPVRQATFFRWQWCFMVPHRQASRRPQWEYSHRKNRQKSHRGPSPACYLSWEQDILTTGGAFTFEESSVHPVFRFQAFHRRDWGPPPVVSHPSPPPLQASRCVGWPLSWSGQGPARRRTCVHSLVTWQNSHSMVSWRTCFEISREGTLTTSPRAASDDHSKFFPDFCRRLRLHSSANTPKIRKRDFSLPCYHGVSKSLGVRFIRCGSTTLGTPGQCDKSSKNVLPGLVWSTLYKLSPLILTLTLWGYILYEFYEKGHFS